MTDKKQRVSIMKPIIIITTFLLCAIYSFGQDYYKTEAEEAAKIGPLIDSCHWDTLPGRIPVLYSKNYKIRAKAIQSMIEDCAGFYEKKFPGTKFNFQIMLPDQRTWLAIRLDDFMPYGFPTYNWKLNKIFIGADKQAVGKTLTGHNDETPDSVIVPRDVIALHEMGHIFLQTVKNIFTGKKWADEFLASYFKICFTKENEQYKDFPGNKAAQLPQYRTLKDFERLYTSVGVVNYGWYQGKFQELGMKLYPKLKMKLLKKFVDNYSPGGKRLPPLVLLKHLAPDITNEWLKEME